MHWKFLLFGITGNLAKIKILPGLGEFTFLNQDKLSVELIGYSRSLPNLEEVEKALNLGVQNLEKVKNQNSKINEQNPTQILKHNLTNITFEQGNYEDGKVLFENIAKLKTDEKLVVYLAVPPSTFLKFLQNACPYGDQNVDFIIEKPFGRDPIEAAKLLNLVENCGLSKQVHFCDHYLFKNSTLLTNLQSLEIQKFFENSSQNSSQNSNLANQNQNLDLQSNSDTKQILEIQPNWEKQQFLDQTTTENQTNQKPISSKIHLQILENVDLKGRSGYFDTTGAFKDMWPHLFSLLFLAVENTGFETDFEVEVVDVFLGQYQSYADEEGLSNSRTETYFWIKLKVKQNQSLNKNSTNNSNESLNESTEIILESGKNLPNKITQITLNDKYKILNWSIYPHENITLTQNSKIENSAQDPLEDLAQNPQTDEQIIINLKKDKLDQTNLFELLLMDNKKRFVQNEKIQKSWNWWQKITQFIEKNQIAIQIYPDQTLPKIEPKI